jgi:hypothetical protein
MRMSQEEMARALQDIDQLEIPSIEKQKLQLNLMSEAGFLTPEELEESRMEGITVDPRLKEAQMTALAELQERGEVGLTPQEREQFRQMQRDVSADTQARQASILQDMAQRGTLDSGAQLAAQLQANQMAAQRASEAGGQLAAQSDSARREALQRAAGAASGIRTQEFGEQQARASAADAINQFNVGLRTQAQQQNLGIRQQDIATMNQQQQYNKQLQQQKFQNELSKAQAKTGIRTGQAQQYAQQSAQQQQAEQASAAGTRSLITAPLGSDALMKKIF